MIQLPRKNENNSSNVTIMRLRYFKNFSAIAVCAGLTSFCSGQNAPAAQTAEQQDTPQATAPASPVSTASITGPLQAAAPIVIDGGALGKLDLDGVVSGIGLWQGNHVPGDDIGQAALSNGQVFVQKTTGWWQFYVQAGAYDILALGTPFLPTDKALTDLYGPVPVAFLKLVPGKNTSIQIGALPTLIGAEYTFDFENVNIEHGLLWNQENAVNRGIQVNQTMGKFSASLSWNDGYYSNRYSWLSGSLTYTKGPHSLSFIGMGNLGHTARQTFATPLQNNGSMYALIYTYTKGNWIIQLYYQYGSVPTNSKVGVAHGASTDGGAVLVSRTFKRGFSVAGRGEYIASSGSAGQNSLNLLYGPGSGAWSVTLTPTYQYQRFFTRVDISFVRASSLTPGDAFGFHGTNPNQPRAVIEVGLIF
jgi:Putative beta-barrel porin-2, OmpL-like. bbp2